MFEILPTYYSYKSSITGRSKEWPSLVLVSNKKIQLLYKVPNNEDACIRGDQVYYVVFQSRVQDQCLLFFAWAFCYIGSNHLWLLNDPRVRQIVLKQKKVTSIYFAMSLKDREVIPVIKRFHYIHIFNPILLICRISSNVITFWIDRYGLYPIYYESAVCVFYTISSVIHEKLVSIAYVIGIHGSIVAIRGCVEEQITQNKLLYAWTQ